MKLKDWSYLILLAALWGASFLFMRVAVPEFGAVPLIFVRVSLAACLLLPLIWWKKRQGVIKRHWRAIALVGILNSAIPFSLIAFSTLYVTAGFASVLNAATPMCAAIVAYIWFEQKLSRLAISGLIIGLSGVVLLVWDKIGFSSGASGVAIAAGLLASLFYGTAANYSKKHLQGVDALSITTGSLIAASLFLLPLAAYQWPVQAPLVSSWLHVLILAIFCTGFAYILYFRLIESAGPANATTVTFLMPVFGMLWGSVFLNEVIAGDTIIGCIIILLGTAMTTGLIKRLTRRPA